METTVLVVAGFVGVTVGMFFSCISKTRQGRILPGAVMALSVLALMVAFA